ncbi:DJ-1/PfpI family protein [bacterium]|nr:DJ-1/PfpI family protein [bacterium]
MKKIALVIANKDFRDEEFFITKKVLEENGIHTVVFSNEVGRAIGKFGGEYNVEKYISDINEDDFEGIVFIGGSGAIERLDNNTSYGIIKSFFSAEKIIAAICISPVILARAKVLMLKKATVWSSNMDKGAISILKENGAEYIDEPVVVDKNIVTGQNFEASRRFGEIIAALLTNN